MHPRSLCPRQHSAWVGTGRSVSDTARFSSVNPDIQLEDGAFEGKAASGTKKRPRPKGDASILFHGRRGLILFVCFALAVAGGKPEKKNPQAIKSVKVGKKPRASRSNALGTK